MDPYNVYKVLVWVKQGDYKPRARGMNLVFKNNEAAEMLIKSADAKCCLKLVSTQKGIATLQMIVTVDSEKVMYADSTTDLYVGDTITVPGITVPGTTIKLAVS